VSIAVSVSENKTVCNILATQELIQQWGGRSPLWGKWGGPSSLPIPDTDAYDYYYYHRIYLYSLHRSILL